MRMVIFLISVNSAQVDDISWINAGRRHYQCRICGLYFDHTKCTYISLKCEICSRKYKYRHYKNNPPKQKQDQGCHQNIPAPHRYKMKKIQLVDNVFDKYQLGHKYIYYLLKTRKKKRYLHPCKFIVMSIWKKY
jgi:hypothetical protein